MCLHHLSEFSDGAHITFLSSSDPLVHSLVECETEDVETALRWDQPWQQLNAIFLAANSVFKVSSVLAR